MTATEFRAQPTDWPALIADADGPQLIVAGPGAGKTEFLVRRAAHLIETDGRRSDSTLLLSFSRRTTADLRTRLSALLDRSIAGMPTMTFHSLALRLVEAYGVDHGWSRVPALLTSPEQVAVVERMLAAEDPRDWPLAFRGMLTSSSFATEVTDFVLRCREHLLGPGDVERRAERRDDWAGLGPFLGRYDAELRRIGRIDYGTIQSEAVRMLGDPDVAAEVADRFHYVLVDEYQDTTVAQARLLEALTASHRNLTVAGDPYQSIYSFRGAEIDNIARFPEEFPDLDGTPARRIVLTTSFRVPEAILEAAVRVTASGDLPGGAGVVVPAPGTGSVEAYRFDQHTHEAEWIAGELERMHVVDGIPYRDMAILVRSKRRLLPELARALDRRGIAHDRPDRRLVDHPAVRIVFDLVRAATGHEFDRGRSLRRLLLGPLATLPIGEVREAEQRVSAGSPWPVVLHELGFGEVGDLLGEPAWATDLPAAEGFWHAWSSIPQFVPLAKEDPTFRRVWASFAQVLGRLAERDPGVDLATHMAWSEAEDFEATPLLEFESPDVDRLVLTSLHQAKGRDFDVVVIADAVDGVFPDLRRRETLLQTRHLGADRDVREWTRFALQEEMRLAYTAMCRARRRVVWTCTSVGDETGSGTPSRFLDLVAPSGTVPPPTHADPVTPTDAEAWLQRMARDPAVPASRRLAALHLLATPADWRPRAPDTITGVLARGRDVGLIDGDALIISPSQAEAYAVCPRKYALERRLLVDEGGSVYAAFGSILHDALERAERSAQARGSERATLDDALDALEEVWEPGAFGGGAWAAAWHRRAERILTHLFDHWPGKGSTALVEVPVEMERDGVRWRGRIDRIEQAPGGLHIVDYKTSTRVPTVADSAASIQLGFYALAASTTASIAELGPVTGAEFWYPAVASKSVTRRTLDLDQLDEVGARLDEIAQALRTEDWTPVRSRTCDRCAVKQVCPEWPEGREAFSR